MKNKQEILGFATNIALVILLLCFIVVGLNVIGVYSLPAPIEKLLGTYDGDENFGMGDDSESLNSASFDTDFLPLEQISLGYENAYAVLSGLSPRENYSQKVRTVHLYGGYRRAEFLGISRRNGMYSVNISDDAGKLIKKISESDNKTVIVSEFYDDNQTSATISKGEFDVSEELGFVLTAKEFLESGYELSHADFKQFSTDDGSFLSVEFDTVFNGSTLRHKYVISLDFGVVTEVYSYENDTIIYEMTTELLSSVE